MAGIMETLFGKIPQQQQAAPTNQKTPGNIPDTPNKPAAAGTGVVPADGANGPNGSVDPNQSPLDAFKDVWQTAATDPNKAADTGFFNLDRTKLSAAAAKGNYLGAINPEVLKKIAAGGEESIAALQQVLNSVGAKTFEQSTITQTQMIEAALTKQREQIMAELPNLIRGQNLSESLKATNNPIFSHPATAPIMDAIQAQLQVKNPTATTAELKSMAENYITMFAAAASPAKPDKVAEANKDTDWSQFLA